MKILVGSENPVKIRSVRDGFLTFFEHVEVRGMSLWMQVFRINL